MKRYINIRAELLKQDIKQNDFAAMIGIGTSALSNKLRGASGFTLDEAYKVLEALNKPDDMLGYYFPKEECYVLQKN